MSSPRSILICFSKDAKSVRAAAIEITTSLRCGTDTPQLFLRSVFCTGQSGELNDEGMGIITLVSFESLMVALMPRAISPGLQYCFWFAFLIGKVPETSSDPTIIDSQLICQKTSTEILHIVNCIYSNYSLRNWGSSHRVGPCTYLVHCNSDLSYDSISSYCKPSF